MHPLRHAQTPCPGDERLWQPRLQGIQDGSRLAPDLEDVLEAAGREQHNPRAATLEQRIGRDGGTVVQPGGRISGNAAQAIGDGACRIVGRRSELQDDEAVADHPDEVSERAAGVDADDDGEGRQALALADLVSAFALESVLVDVESLEVDETLSEAVLESFAPALPVS